MGAVDSATELAAQLEAANEAVARFALACDDEQWRTVVPGEEWPVAVVVHHVAVSHELMMKWLGRVARGDDITDDASEIDAANGRHAQEFVAVGVDDTVALLRSNGARLAELIGGFDDEQLGRTAAFGPGNGMTVSTEGMAGVATRHCEVHLANARAAVGMEGG